MADTVVADSESIDIAAPPQRVLELLADVESYPVWTPNCTRAVVHERDGAGRPLLASFEVNAVVKTLRYTLRYRHQPHGLAWQMVEGNMGANDGSFTVAYSGDDATTVTYQYTQSPRLRLPRVMVRQGVRFGAQQVLRDLKTAAEAP